MKLNIFLYSGNPGPGMLDLPRTSQKLGFDTRVIVVDRGLDDLIADFTGILDISTVFKMSGNGVSARRMLTIPRIFLILASVVCSSKNKAVSINVHTLDCLIASFVLKRLFYFRKISLVYQIRDLHKSQVSREYSSRVMQYAERLLVRDVSLFCFSSLGFFDFYKRKYRIHDHYILLENVPRSEVFRKALKSHRSERSEVPVVGYIGILRYFESLDYLCKSINALDGAVAVYIAGGGDKTIFSQLSGSVLSWVHPAFRYIEEVDNHYSNIDIVYAVYDASDFNCQVAMPNKFYEAILFRKPIIVAANTYLAERVQSLGIGVAVRLGSDDLANALREISYDGSWYQAARRNLLSIDRERMIVDYEKALRDVVC